MKTRKQDGHRFTLTKSFSVTFLLLFVVLLNRSFLFASVSATVTDGDSPLSLQTNDAFKMPLRIDTYGQAWEGYLAYGLFELNQSDPWTAPRSHLIVMNTNGELRFVRHYDDWSYYDVELVAPYYTLMYQGEQWTQTHFWDLKTNKTIDFLNVYGHHDVEYNPKTETFLTLWGGPWGLNGTNTIADEIVELDKQGNILWRWSTLDYFNINQRCPYDDPGDFTHANTVSWNQKENIVYLNIRNLDTFSKINKTTGKLIWNLGRYGNFMLIDENGKKVESLWYHSHGLKEVEPNVFLMFDNDFHNKTDLSNRRSRIIEVTVDEKNMTARISWSWTAPEEYWSPFWGDADRLPNGDRIGTFGTFDHYTKYSTGAVLVEVNQLGEVVRTYTFPKFWGIYRIEEMSALEFTAPKTKLAIGEPKYIDSTGSIYASSQTQFTLEAEDNLGGTGVASTFYRIFNSRYILSGLVLYFPFWEDSGSNIEDVSLFRNDGTVHGASRTGFGRIGNAMSFNDLDSSVLVDDNDSLNMTQISVELWFKIDSWAYDWNWLIGTRHDSTWRLQVSRGGEIRIDDFPISGNYYDLETFGSGVSLGSWYHMVFTFDGTHMKFYVNGIETGSATHSGIYQPANTGLDIGSGTYGGNINQLNGIIDEVRVYNRALSTAEILQNYSQSDKVQYFSGWQKYSVPFSSTGLSDGEYSIDYYSTDKIGNAEQTNTAIVILDSTSPTTTLMIGEPQYASDATYVTSDTQFNLQAEDSGSGVASVTYKIYNNTYGDWQTYANPFHLTTLTDGIYTIAYKSVDKTDNAENSHQITVTLFSWNYGFSDSYGRGTILKINTQHKLFQFTTTSREYGIREATRMLQNDKTILIKHYDNELRIIALSINNQDFCITNVWDVQTGKHYLLIDKLGIK